MQICSMCSKDNFVLSQKEDPIAGLGDIDLVFISAKLGVALLTSVEGSPQPPLQPCCCLSSAAF